jgi:small GTP-binding protein
MVHFTLWDTAGMERFLTIVTAYYRGTDIFMMVYDVTQKSSLETLSRYIPQRYAIPDSRQVFAIVGTKCDLPHTVTIHDAKKWAEANQLPNCLFFEVSSLDGTNINEMFQAVAEQMYSNMPPSLLN